MRDLPEQLRAGPFTTAQAHPVGVSSRVLAGTRFRQLYRGVHIIAATELTDQVRLQAALLAGPPDAVISHRSAQRLFGPKLRGGDDAIDLSPRGTAASRDGRIRVHRRRHTIAHRWIDGLPVTTPARTLVDCALVLTFLQLVVFGDWLVRQRQVTLDDLAAYCRTRHLDGVAVAREAVGLVVPDSRSPMESVLRLMIVFAGLPRPAANATVLDEAGRKVGTFDLVLVLFRIVVEYDGRWHERSADQRRADRDRREHLERLGWLVLTVFDTESS